ncbi:MAG: AAA family ATPase [Bacteroidales bacterium]|nr:AAA family ATPase [Bacteroidales bacterium]MBN2758077.1 AAA family ATPase [Bacteroidales bacterium]
MGKIDYKYGDPYKFKSLKIYSSAEWMVNSTKKYRRVFDKSEVTYIRSEFTFYNKLFDEDDWDAKINIKTFEIQRGKRKEICNLEEKMNISKDNPEVQVYKSWGVDDEGGFWDKGDYICEAYIDDKLVGSEKFYIEDVGRVSINNNPFFDIESIKLYSGSSTSWEEKDHKYLIAFNKTETQYVWVEIKIKNKTEKDWNFEFFINFYDDAGQFKAQISSLYFIDSKTKNTVYTYHRGWGNDDKGSWKDDKYTVEIVFMDNLVAALPFTMGNSDIEGDNIISKVSHSLLSDSMFKTQEENEKTLEELMAELNNLIGLENIKKQITEHIEYIEFLKLRKEKGLKDEEKISLHSIFTGNPGTGKTTVVKLLGKIYNKMGLLSKGHIHEVDRVDLVGEYIGQTAPKVKKAIEAARGGVLFIDEAYALMRSKDDSKDYGREVIEILIKEMSDGPGDIAIMAAGYPKEMDNFIEFNPGLKSRFKYYFHFDDYTPDELLNIAKYAANKRAVLVEEKAIELIQKILIEAYRNRDKSFGNARYAYSLIDEAKMNLGLRLIKHPNVKKLSDKHLSTILLEDVEKLKSISDKKHINIPIDEELLKFTVEELNTLVGMNHIKTEINDLIKLVRYYRETGKEVLNIMSMHTVFTGNPGTGKTTVARIIGKIFKALGLLERGHLVETGREGLVAGYIGQTAIKTKDKIDESMGGVLFIDEAYALSDGSGENSFGKEAIEVILKIMEDKRGKFSIIAAGYPGNMQMFLESNPGLKSRFDRVWHFNDYSPETLYNIALSMFAKEKLEPDTQASEFLINYMNQLYQKRDKFFGNARTVRKIVEQSVQKQNLRMASLPSEERTTAMMATITMQDLAEIKIDSNKEERKSMGFR